MNLKKMFYYRIGRVKKTGSGTKPFFSQGEKHQPG